MSTENETLKKGGKLENIAYHCRASSGIGL